MIIFLYGENDFFIKEKVAQFKERFSREVDRSGYNFTKMNGKTMAIADLVRAVTTQSFLAKKRMVIIEDVFGASKKNQEEMLEWLKDKKLFEGKDDNVVIITANEYDKKNVLWKYLSKAKLSEYFPQLEVGSLRSWANDKIEESGSKIDNQALVHLVQMSGGDMWALKNEIDKLVARCKSKEIGMEDLQDIVMGKVDESIFNIMDAIAERRTPKALRLVNDALDNGANGIYLLSMIARQFRIMLLIASLKEVGQSDYRSKLKNMGIHPYAAQKAEKQQRGFGLQELKLIYKSIMKIDAGLKKGGDDKVMLERLVVMVGR